MTPDAQSFESLQTQFAQQTAAWLEARRALESLHPGEHIAAEADFFREFEAACAVTSFATASRPLPMGIRG